MILNISYPFKYSLIKFFTSSFSLLCFSFNFLTSSIIFVYLSTVCHKNSISLFYCIICSSMWTINLSIFLGSDFSECHKSYYFDIEVLDMVMLHNFFSLVERKIFKIVYVCIVNFGLHSSFGCFDVWSHVQFLAQLFQ